MSQLRDVDFITWKRVMRALMYYQLFGEVSSQSGTDGSDVWRQYFLDGAEVIRLTVLEGAIRLSQDCDKIFEVREDFIDDSDWCYVPNDAECEIWIQQGKNVDDEISKREAGRFEFWELTYAL